MVIKSVIYMYQNQRATMTTARKRDFDFNFQLGSNTTQHNKTIQSVVNESNQDEVSTTRKYRFNIGFRQN